MSGFPIRRFVWILAGMLLASGSGKCTLAQVTDASDNQAVLTAQPRPFQSARLIERRGDYLKLKDKSREWFDQLKVDPIFLLRQHFSYQGRDYRIKGIKKLGEILEAYLHHYLHAEDQRDRAAILQRVIELSKATGEDEYHRLLLGSEKVLVENSTSYFRVAINMEEFGLDTSYYRQKLREAKPRLDRHLRQRGSIQRTLFRKYYDRFALPRPEILDQPLADGVIDRRIRLEDYNKRLAYDFTHEVYVAFDYGLSRTQTQFTPRDLAYARRMLPRLMSLYIRENDVDLVSELVNCGTYFGWHHVLQYRRGIEYLLDNQNSNGTWGQYERYRPIFGDYVDQFIYLHTTKVASIALLEVFEGDWPPSGPPGRNQSSVEKIQWGQHLE